MEEKAEIVPSKKTLRRFGQSDQERYDSNQYAGFEELADLKDSYTMTILLRYSILTVYGVAHILDHNWKLPYLGSKRKEILRKALDKYLAEGHKKKDPPINIKYQTKDL